MLVFVDVEKPGNSEKSPWSFSSVIAARREQKFTVSWSKCNHRADVLSTPGYNVGLNNIIIFFFFNRENKYLSCELMHSQLCQA